jgi:surface antigen
VCFADDPLEAGQCGWYALGRRPDLLPYIEGSQRAGEWLADAAGQLPESTAPRVGALAVWSVASDPPDGHVGYVAAVSAAEVLIDDSNWRPTPQSPGLQIHEHWVPAKEPAGYIYEA